MKAKDYVDSVIRGAMSAEDVAKKMILEINTIAKVRNAKRESAFHSIVEEQRKKWKAFCRLMKKCGIDVNIVLFAKFLNESLNKELNKLEKSLEKPVLK